MSDNLTSTVNTVCSSNSITSGNDNSSIQFSIADDRIKVTGLSSTDTYTIQSGETYSNNISIGDYTANDYSFTYQPLTSSSYVWPNNGWQSIEDIIEKKLAEEKQKDKMSNTDFSFGPYTSNNLRLSTFGIALKNKENKWVSFDRQRNAIVDVNILNIEIENSKIFYKFPKAISDVEVGDIVLHNGNLMFVEEIKDNRFVVINPYEGTELTILPSMSPFGFNYVTVIISITDYLPEADSNNPFGSLLPLMFIKDNNNNNNLLALFVLTQKNNIDIDPTMLMLMGGSPYLYFMLNNKKDKNNKVNEKDNSKD